MYESNNKVNKDLKAIASEILISINDQNVLLGHTNNNYDVSKSVGPNGILNDEVEIFVDHRTKDAEVFDTKNPKLNRVKLKETVIKFAVDKVCDITFDFKLHEQAYRRDLYARAIDKGAKGILNFLEKCIVQEVYSKAKVVKTNSGTIENTADFARLGRFYNDELNLDNNGSNVSVFLNSETIERIESSGVHLDRSAKGKEYFDKGLDTKSGSDRSIFVKGNGYLFDAYSVSYYKCNLLNSVKNIVGDVDLSGFAGDVKYKSQYVTIEDADTGYKEQGLKVTLTNAGEVEAVIPAGAVIVAGTNAHRVLKKITLGASETTSFEVKSDTEDFYTINTNILNGEVEDANVELKQINDFGNIAFNTEAIAFGIRSTPIEPNLGGETNASIGDTGVSISVKYFKDQETKGLSLSVDCMYGIKAITSGIAVF